MKWDLDFYYEYAIQVTLKNGKVVSVLELDGVWGLPSAMYVGSTVDGREVWKDGDGIMYMI